MQPPTHASARVLVIEDNDDVRDMLVLYLAACGVSVTDAADGLSGLEAGLREQPDVVLVDLGLPGLDGLSLARRLRDAGLRGRIVAMSGYAREFARGRGDTSAIDEWLVKPVAPAAILEIVRRAA